jgi:hypothetical protein
MLYLKLFIVTGITWFFEVASFAEGSKSWFWYKITHFKFSLEKQFCNLQVPNRCFELPARDILLFHFDLASTSATNYQRQLLGLQNTGRQISGTGRRT